MTHQSNLPKPRQTPKRAVVSIPEWAVAADVTGVTVHDFVKVVMAEMEPLFERTITSAVAIAIEAMLPQLEASITAENERMSKEISDLRSTLQSQAFELDRLAQYSRHENGRLHGVPETAGENTNDVLIAVASDIGVHINEHDISVSHRLQKSRPIIVTFVRRGTKIDVMRKKKTLCTIDRYRNTFINDEGSKHPECSVTDCAEASPQGTRWMASRLRAYSALKHCVSCLEIVVVYGVALA